MKVITIGRSTENNDIVVNDEKVSRNHLQMVMDDSGNYSVVDLGSTNGTYVNGQRISGEVRLQLGDEVRIGQTVLPWQNYFQPPTNNLISHPQPPKPRPNRTWLYVVIGIALLLLIGGGVALKIYGDKKEKAKQEQEILDNEAEDAKRKEAEDARLKASKASEEYEKALRKAAETQSEEDLAYAEKMRIKAEEANQLAQRKEAEWNRMKAELDAANKAKDVAEEQSRQDAEAKREADSVAEQARQEAIKAKLAQQEAEKEADLTKQFYRLISQVKPKILMWEPDYYQKIINELGWTAKAEEDKKDFIIKRFEDGNQTQKQRIIDAVKKVLEQQDKDINPSAVEKGSAKENEKLPEALTNDTIVMRLQDTID